MKIRWPWARERSESRTADAGWQPSAKGIKAYGVYVNAPAQDASDEQWRDFAACAGIFAWEFCPREWRRRALRAYLARYPDAGSDLLDPSLTRTTP